MLYVVVFYATSYGASPTNTDEHDEFKQVLMENKKHT
jgi:hypothetical protein